MFTCPLPNTAMGTTTLADIVLHGIGSMLG